MKQRPVSMAVIGWILIIIAISNIIISTIGLNSPMAKELMAQSPFSIPVQLVMLYFGLLALLASGIGIHKGRNWARWLYVVWNSFRIIVGLSVSPMTMMMIPWLIFFIVIVFFLFRPVANRYFAAPAGEYGK